MAQFLEKSVRERDLLTLKKNKILFTQLSSHLQRPCDLFHFVCMHQQIYKNKQVNKCLIIQGVESIPQLGVQKANCFLQNFLEDSQETGSSWSWSGAETLFHSTSKELYINEALSFIILKLSQSKKNLLLVLVRPGAYVLQTRVKIQI